MSVIAPASAAATLPAFLARVRLRAERRVLWLRKLWGAAPDVARGFAITDDDVDVILSSPAILAAREEELYAIDPRARELAPLIAEADDAARSDPGLSLLRRAFRLVDAEVDLLSLCIAAEADPALRPIYGYIHDDATLGYATPWLAATLFQWGEVPSFGPGSALVHWWMARPVD